MTAVGCDKIKLNGYILAFIARAEYTSLSLVMPTMKLVLLMVFCATLCLQVVCSQVDGGDDMQQQFDALRMKMDDQLRQLNIKLEKHERENRENDRLKQDVAILNSKMNQEVSRITIKFEDQERENEMMKQAMAQLSSQLHGMEDQMHDSAVAFYATLSSDRIYEDGGTIIFDRAVTNVGGHYSTALGAFQCPVDGYYFFSCTLLSRSYRSSAKFMKNDAEINHKGPMTSNQGGDNSGSSTFNVITRCYTNEVVFMRAVFHDADYPAVNLHGTESAFSGFLIGPA